MVPVLYWGEEAEQFALCFTKLTTGIPDARLEEQATLGELCRSLMSRRSEDLVVVLAPKTRADLLGVSAIRSLLLGVSVVVRLQSEETESLKMAHQLHPRFVSTGGFDVASVAAIVVNLACNRERLRNSRRPLENPLGLIQDSMLDDELSTVRVAEKRRMHNG